MMITCQKKSSHWPGCVFLVSAGLRVTAGYPQMEKDSVAAVLIQRYADYISLRVSVTNYPNSIGSVQGLPDDIGLVQHSNHVNDVHSVDCLVLRFSDLSFFSQASITHDEKFEFSRPTLELISSINSCGKRIPFVVDLLFLYPVAISINSLSWCRNTIQEIMQIKILDVFMHLVIRCLCTPCCIGAKIATPRSATNTAEAFNHNVMESYDMAMYKSTQTHPKFKWRFFSCQQSRYFTVEARSEQEARSMLPDAPCLFSARIRQGVNYV